MLYTFLLIYILTPTYAINASSGLDFSNLSSFIPLISGLVIFYFLLIRPQQTKMKNHKLVLMSVKIGDNVVLSSGIHGIITNILDEQFMIQVAKDVEILVDKEVIAKFDPLCIERVPLKKNHIADIIMSKVPLANIKQKA